MLRSLMKKWKYFQAYGQTRRESDREQAPERPPELVKDLSRNLMSVRQILGRSNDVKIHEFRFGKDGEHGGALIFIDGLVDGEAITQGILRPLMNYRPAGERGAAELLQEIEHAVLLNAEVEEKDELAGMISGCMSGNTLLLIHGTAKGLLVSTKGWEKRGVTEPMTEAVIRGPREGFTENLRTNTALLRRKIKSPDFRIEHIIVGRKTLTDVCLLYLKGVADLKVIEEVKSRLKGLSVDSILDAGYIEQYMEDAPFSIFPTVGYTEKPDVAAAKILEGRIAIVTDGSPFVLTIPMLFIENFQTAEDYYIRPFFASMARLLRYVAYFIAIFATPIYIALTTFHQEMIPTTLLLTVAKAREGTPFPAFVESLIMVFSFEILREGGLRLPRPVGQAISIVGALIMGDASVSAGLVGAPLVIAVALTAVSGFLVPAQNDTVSILRLISMILAAVLGGYGIAMVFLGVLMHLASLKSFGVSYFEGFPPSRDMQDAVIRLPLWMMVKRPKDIAQRDTTRRRFFIPPMETGTEDAKGSQGAGKKR